MVPKFLNCTAYNASLWILNWTTSWGSMPNPHPTPSSKSSNTNMSMPQSGRGKGKGRRTITRQWNHEAETALRATASPFPAAAPQICVPLLTPPATASKPPLLIPPSASSSLCHAGKSSRACPGAAAEGGDPRRAAMSCTRVCYGGRRRGTREGRRLWWGGESRGGRSGKEDWRRRRRGGKEEQDEVDERKREREGLFWTVGESRHFLCESAAWNREVRTNKLKYGWLVNSVYQYFIEPMAHQSFLSPHKPSLHWLARHVRGPLSMGVSAGDPR